VLDKLTVENKTFAKITPKARIEKNMVDRVALREMVINAIVHNDYTREVPPVFEIFSDRITITSYGGLVEGLTKEDFLSCLSMPRNRELMRIFRDVDLVEQLGSGMGRILKVYNDSIFRFKPNFLIITIPFEIGFIKNDILGGATYTFDSGFPFELGINNNDTVNDTVNETVNEIIKIISQNKNVSIKSIVKETGKSRATITRIIKELKESKKLKRVGSDKTGYWELL
jgi:predicted HTH transcriptional regulator